MTRSERVQNRVVMFEARRNSVLLEKSEGGSKGNEGSQEKACGEMIGEARKEKGTTGAVKEKKKKEKKKMRGNEEGRRKEPIEGGNKELPIVLCSQERTRVLPQSTRHGVSDMNKTEDVSNQPTEGEYVNPVERFKPLFFGGNPQWSESPITETNKDFGRKVP